MKANSRNARSKEEVTNMNVSTSSDDITLYNGILSRFIPSPLPTARKNIMTGDITNLISLLHFKGI